MNKRTVGLVALESFITRGEKKKAQYHDLMIEVHFVKELLNRDFMDVKTFRWFSLLEKTKKHFQFDMFIYFELGSKESGT